MSLIGTKETRFFDSSTNSPGPGRYNDVINLNANSKYPTSNIKGQGKRIIGNELRKTFIDKARTFSAEVPSPGTYRL